MGVDAAALAPATAAFLLSLLGGLHCAGMCGGFLAALKLGPAAAVSGAPAGPAPVAVLRDPRAARHHGRRVELAYHAGRIASYTLAGVLVGALGGALFAADVLPVQLVLLVAGSAMLVAVGAALLGRGRWLRRFEPLGAWLWARIAPLARRFFPPRTPGQALLAGLAWGWIPCGLVYGALPLALTSGGPVRGAAVMLAFGLGTLPNLLALGWLVGRAGEWSGRRALAWVRPLAGALIVAFGISGLAHAARVAGAQHPAIEAMASFCHS